MFDLHIWSITSGNIALSAHIVIFDSTKSQEMLREINSLLEKKIEIYHTTIQIEKYHTVDDRGSLNVFYYLYMKLTIKSSSL